MLASSVLLGDFRAFVFICFQLAQEFPCFRVGIVGFTRGFMCFRFVLFPARSRILVLSLLASSGSLEDSNVFMFASSVLLVNSDFV